MREMTDTGGGRRGGGRGGKQRPPRRDLVVLACVCRPPSRARRARVIAAPVRPHAHLPLFFPHAAHACVVPGIEEEVAREAQSSERGREKEQRAPSCPVQREPESTSSPSSHSAPPLLPLPTPRTLAPPRRPLPASPSPRAPSHAHFGEKVTTFTHHKHTQHARFFFFFFFWQHTHTHTAHTGVCLELVWSRPVPEDVAAATPPRSAHPSLAVSQAHLSDDGIVRGGRGAGGV